MNYFSLLKVLISIGLVLYSQLRVPFFHLPYSPHIAATPKIIKPTYIIEFGTLNVSRPDEKDVSVAAPSLRIMPAIQAPG